MTEPVHIEILYLLTSDSMVFSSLFSRGSERTDAVSSWTEPSIFSRMWDVAKRVSLALGCTSANVNSTPHDNPPAPQQHIKNESAFDPIQKMDFTKPILTQPLEIPVVAEKKGVEPLSFTPELPRATAIKGQSVAVFMMKNFHRIEGWEYLVDSVSGHRVRNSYRDLIAGRTYILASNEKEAQALSTMLKQKAKEDRLAKKQLKLEAKQASKKAASQVVSTETQPRVKLMPPTIPPPDKDTWGREPEKITKVTPLVTQKPAPVVAEKKLEKAKSARVESLKTSPDKKTTSSREMDTPGHKKVSPLHMRIIPLYTREQALALFEAARSDIITFFRAIGAYESGNNPLARNPSGALGIYQILEDNLPGLGFSDEQIRRFPHDIRLQQEAMRRFTNKNIQIVLDEPAVVDLLCYGVHPFEVLAAAHHGGHGLATGVARKAVKYANPVAAFHQRLKGSTDKRVTTATYIKAIMRGCGLENSVHAYRLAATGTESIMPASRSVPAPISTSQPGVTSQGVSGSIIPFSGAKSTSGSEGNMKLPNISQSVPQTQDSNESTNIAPFKPSKRNVAVENQLKATGDIERKVVAHVADALHREDYGEILNHSLIHHSKLAEEGNIESLQTVQKLLTLRQLEERERVANLFGADGGDTSVAELLEAA